MLEAARRTGGQMSSDGVQRFIGEWELSADFPGAEDLRGRVVFEWLYGGPLLLERSEAPDPAPDSVAVIGPSADGTYLQHYFDSRGVVRLYAMTFDGETWTLTRTTPDFSPLDFHQRYVGRFSADGTTIDGAWETSDDGANWHRDFGLTYRRMR
jgi:hypothetical protein